MNKYLEELYEKGQKQELGWFVPYETNDYTPGDLPTATTARGRFTQKYSWAIPNDKAIDTLVKYDPIIEVGAGNGYWASLVKEEGGDIIATDIDPSTNSLTNSSNTWTIVEECDYSVIDEYQDRTLFMCWPSYSEDWTAEALKLYEGDTLIYIGEGRGGCTGNQEFHREIDREFGTATEIVHIPQWRGIRDRMYIFER